jgi:hypothetical protein
MCPTGIGHLSSRRSHLKSRIPDGASLSADLSKALAMFAFAATDTETSPVRPSGLSMYQQRYPQRRYP